MSILERPRNTHGWVVGGKGVVFLRATNDSGYMIYYLFSSGENSGCESSWGEKSGGEKIGAKRPGGEKSGRERAPCN